MKRYVNTLLQRKRVEFEGANDRGGPSSSNDEVDISVVQVKDGYDWWQVVKRTGERRQQAQH
jgi:hypothetical protein